MGVSVSRISLPQAVTTSQKHIRFHYTYKNNYAESHHHHHHYNVTSIPDHFLNADITSMKAVATLSLYISNVRHIIIVTKMDINI